MIMMISSKHIYDIFMITAVTLCGNLFYLQLGSHFVTFTIVLITGNVSWKFDIVGRKPGKWVGSPIIAFVQ